MQKAYVIMSYWYGTHDDEARFGEDAKVERVVIGDRDHANAVEKKIQEQIRDKYRYCYTDVIETEAE